MKIGYGVACALAATPTLAQTWRFVPSASLQETLTNNVNLAPSASAQSDLVTQLTPGFTVTESSARTNLTGSVSVPILLYAKTGAENNHVYPGVNLLGTVEPIEKFFFIESAVNVEQQYYNPFGAQPQGFTNGTPNRYTTQSYRVSPYLQGGTPRDFQYSARDDNVWTNLNGAPISPANGTSNVAYTNQLILNASRQPGQFGTSADYNRTSVKFSDQAPLLTQIGRVHGIDNVDAALQLSADVGYEDNDYTFSKFSGAIYGVSAQWHPTDRTTVNATWEHRFFGSSYLFDFSHRTPLSVWNLSASRNITSYPQQLAGLPAGFDIASQLNQLLLSAFPDPAQRQAFINQFISDNGLSAFAGPVNIFTQQITLQQQANASIGLLGARNSVFLSIYYLQQQPITTGGSELPPSFAALNNNTQEGATATWTHNLAPKLAFSLSGTVARSVPNGSQGEFSKTTQGYVSATLSSPITPNTSVDGGVRYQVLHGDQANSYTEVAAFVTLTHSFR